MPQLRPDASPFVPQTAKHENHNSADSILSSLPDSLYDEPTSDEGSYDHPVDHVDTTHYSDSEGIVSEEGIGEAELAELEELDAWIEAMVDLEEMERAHLMELALSEAPRWKIEEIEKRYASPPSGSVGKRSPPRAAAAAAASAKAR